MLDSRCCRNNFQLVFLVNRICLGVVNLIWFASKLHTTYRDTVEENLLADNHVNREIFMRILAILWPSWASQDTIKKAFKRCLSIEHMQQDTFRSASLVNEGSVPEEPSAYNAVYNKEIS